MIAPPRDIVMFRAEDVPPLLSLSIAGTFPIPYDVAPRPAEDLKAFPGEARAIATGRSSR